MGMRRKIRGRGFTLVEILVVIAIIIILVGTVVAIGTGVRTSAHRKQTVVTLRNLDGLLKLYVEDGAPEPLGPPTNTSVSTTDYVQKFLAYEKTARALRGMSSSVFNGTVVNDGFGNPISFEPSNTTVNPGPARFRSNGPDGVSNPSSPATLTDDILSTEVQ